LFFGFSSGFFTFEFVSGEQIIFVLLGYTALILMVTTVLTAIFYRQQLLLRNWRKIHLLNYLILPLIFFHSKNLGSDVQSPPLSFLWWFYLLTFGAALGYKLLVKKGTPSVQRPSETNLNAPPTST
jgi:DMSO/TMAO reductase YedYZ heme-binding membrane subunit